MIVNKWPETIKTEGGIICNPTPDQCIAAGYELHIPLTAEELAERAAQAQEAESIRMAEIEALRAQYRATVNAFCLLSGIPVVDKFESAQTVADAITAANAGGDIQQIMGLTQAALFIQNLITELRRKDFDDAWDRI